MLSIPELFNRLDLTLTRPSLRGTILADWLLRAKELPLGIVENFGPWGEWKIPSPCMERVPWLRIRTGPKQHLPPAWLILLPCLKSLILTYTSGDAFTDEETIHCLPL